MTANIETGAPDLFDVVIVGYGPVGATLANLLVQQGMRVAVLEREAGVYHLARAGHFDAEIMRVFQSIGVAETIEPETGITNAMRFVDADGAMLMEWRRGGAKGRYGWVSDYMFFQPALERILRDRLETHENAHIYLQHDVYAIHQDGDAVRVDAEDTLNARLVSLRGRYVVGCDGARSLVRRTIGSEHEDIGFKQRWLVVDVDQRRDLGLERVSIQHCNPDRPMFTSVLAHGVLRWEIMLKDGDDIQEVTSNDAVWNFIENSVRPISRQDGVISRSAIYTFESLIANLWRKDRLLIAGDSAHRTPPFLGQGMCAGIRDAANLAWKLAAVCSGKADETLLDTYETERKPHVRAFIVGAVEAGRLVQMTDHDELIARVKDMRENPKSYAPPDPALGHGLNDDYGKQTLGRPVAQPYLRGQLLDEHIGHSFALLFTSGFFSAMQHKALEDRYPALQLIELDNETAAQITDSTQAQAILVRPDRYIHAVAETPDVVASLLEQLPIDLTQPA